MAWALQDGARPASVRAPRAVTASATCCLLAFSESFHFCPCSRLPPGRALYPQAGHEAIRERRPESSACTAVPGEGADQESQAWKAVCWGPCEGPSLVPVPYCSAG